MYIYIILVHVAAIYDALQAVLGFLCHKYYDFLTFKHALMCLLDITEWYEDNHGTPLLGTHSLLST